MRIYPNKYKAYSVEGINVFPLYGSSGCICASYVAILFRNTPLILDGGDFGNEYGTMKSDEGGAWIVIKLPYHTNDADVAHEVRIAEEKLDSWKP